jgi:error-prone DNA polymerase
VELQRPLWRNDRRRNRWLAELAERLGVPCVASGDVHCHDRSRAALQDAFVAVRLGATLEESESRRRGNAASALTSPQQIAARFADHPDAVREAGRVAERLDFDLCRDLGYRYPGSENPDADSKLALICDERLTSFYANEPGERRREAARRLGEELATIRSLGLSGFFLLHRDLLELAREVACEVRGPDSARSLLPPGRGRGSSVSSIVCYLTGLSHVDPVKSELFAGRFLNDEVSAMPDIDLDFPRDIRERLIPRVHERYGSEHSGLVAAFATYRPRGAVRDLGKALGLPPGEIERVARNADYHGGGAPIGEALVAAIGGQRASTPRWRALAAVATEALGLPRHVSQHPGGMVISTQPLHELCPVQPAAMEGRQIVQWDKDSCADAGFLKIDLLGLGMLSAVERCVEEIARVRGERIDLSRIALDDPRVFDSIRHADTVGVFQIESRAQMQMLPRTRPSSIEDLTVQVALVRPGPIQGGAVHPYIERRKALREDPGYEVPYEHPSLEPVLRETLGVIVYQEQVIEVAMAMAGFSAGEAEGLRRAMSRKRSETALRAYGERFVEGAVARGVASEVAERVFGQVMGFSGFGFPKAHSVAFALLAYQSAWLRVHYAAEFLCSLLNEQPMGFYQPDALVHEAQRRGVEVLGPDVNASALECRVESGAVRIGLAYVDGVREEEMRALVEERRRHGAFRDIAEAASRTGYSRDGLEKLAWAGALGAGARREALWQAGVTSVARKVPAGAQLSLPLELPEPPGLPRLSPWERVIAEYGSIGIALHEHPMALMRVQLGPDLATSADLQRLAEGSAVRIAGLVIARQRPSTAHGVVFMLLEDELGQVNVVVPPPVYERNRLAVRTAAFVKAGGRLERREGVINVLVSQIEALQFSDQPLADVSQIGEASRQQPDYGAEADLLAVAPKAHSFGRR